MYIPLAGQIVCGCCGLYQKWNSTDAKINEDTWPTHTEDCCKYEEAEKMMTPVFFRP